ncbi:MAG: HSP20 family protein [Parcubacteria group bacterium Greene0416_79]|nr:MAG: HSP20 family protein [Parcubacteria group bacterium Greene0416_79]
MKEKRSFFERLTGTLNPREEREEEEETGAPAKIFTPKKGVAEETGLLEEGELTADVYQTPDDIIIKTIVAGVRPDDLDISITRDMVTIRGSRQESQEVNEGDYFHRELYWGSFSRTILLPQEVDVDAAEANERHGLLTIRLPKLDKSRQTKLKVRSS